MRQLICDDCGKPIEETYARALVCTVQTVDGVVTSGPEAEYHYHPEHVPQGDNHAE